MLLITLLLILYPVYCVDSTNAWIKHSRECPFSDRIKCGHTKKFSELDGLCNNLFDSNIAKKATPYKRIFRAAYEDKTNSPRSLDSNNDPLPSPRFLSRSLSRDNKELDIWTHLFATFGQFITHDMSEVSEGSEICDCSSTSRECMNIKMSADDPMKQACLPFVRSTSTDDFFCESGQREQLNLATPVLDASQVYGRSYEENKDLRTLRGGLNKTQKIINQFYSLIVYFYFPKKKQVN